VAAAVAQLRAVLFGTVGLSVIAATIGFDRTRRTVRDALLYIAFLWLALAAVRNETQFVIVAAAFVARPLSTAIARVRPSRDAVEAHDRVMSSIVQAATVAVVVLCTVKGAQARNPAEAAMPYQPYKLLAKIPGRHRVFCEQAEWCALSIRTPGTSSYMDARFDAFAVPLWKTSRRIVDLRPGWEDALSAIGVDALIAGDHSSLIDALLIRGTWNVRYHDKYHWLLMRAQS
jgi:hypothetical protein